MAFNLMTGYAGAPHVTSADDGAVNAGLYGKDKVVLDVGEMFAYELLSNNLIRIKDGYAINQGRKLGQPLNEYEDLTIDNGLQGVKRADLIVLRYEKNVDTGIETVTPVVIKGTSGDDYTDPKYVSGDILAGAVQDDMPLYRVKLDGLSVVAVEPVFQTVGDILARIAALEKENDELNSKLTWSEWYDGSTGLFYRERQDGLREIRIHITETKTIPSYNTLYLGKLDNYAVNANIDYIQVPVTCRGASNIMLRIVHNGEIYLYNENGTDVAPTRIWGFIHYSI